jgi:hypothetical protein
MKQYLLKLSFIIAAYSICNDTIAQTGLAPDQNPDFAISRDKYMKITDSLNGWHSTTFQDQYKAIDWLADKREARAERQEFQRRLRLERAAWDGYYYDRSYYYPHSNYNYYRSYHRRHRSYNPRWGFNFWWP